MKKTAFPQPFYYIGFSILNSNSNECAFQTLFSNEQESFKFFLEHGRKGFRYAGWDLPYHTDYSIQLDGLEYKNDKERVQILENGHIIIQATVSESFLCWASSSFQDSAKGNRIQINPTALIEFTYNCVDLLKRAIKDCVEPQKIICDFGFIGMNSNYVLGDAKLMGNRLSFITNREYHPITGISKTKMEIDGLKVASDDGVAKVTYSIISKVYRMFGYPEDIISYVNNGEKKIDINLMKVFK